MMDNKMDVIYEKLERITMEEEAEDIYSDPYENYCRLKRTVTFLKNCGRVTEDWMVEHKGHILKYYEMFPNFSQTNIDVTDKTFRKTASEAETLLNNLIQSIQNLKTFNVTFYRILNEHMIALCEHIFTEDELNLCMSKLTIKN